MNSFKLKNLGSRSEFAQTIVWRGRRGSWGKLELVWSNQRFGHHSLVPISPVLQLVGSSMLCNMLGERSWMSLQMVSLKDLPHTYSCTCFYSKGRRCKQGLCWFWITWESNFYWGKMHEMLKCLSFFLLLFLLYIFYFIFIMENWAWCVTFVGWRNERGCTRYVECLPDGTYQLLNKDARVKLYIHRAKPCILFCLAPCASVSLLDQGVLYEC